MLNISSGYILINNGIRMEYLALKQAAYPRNTRLRSPIAEFSRLSRAHLGPIGTGHQVTDDSWGRQV